MTDLIRPKDIFAPEFDLVEFELEFKDFLLKFTEISRYEITQLTELATLLINEYRNSNLAERKQAIAYILSCYIKGMNPENTKYNHRPLKKNPKTYSSKRDEIIEFVIGINSERISHYVMLGRTAFVVRGVPAGINRRLKDFFGAQES